MSLSLSNISCIYLIQNKVTADFYIGSAVRFLYRQWLHLYELRKNKHHSPILQNAYNKYGEHNFEFYMIEFVPDKIFLIEREQFYLDNLKPKYNCSKIAGSPLGIKHSEQARRNMSEAHKRLTEEQRGHRVDCVCCFCKRPTGKNSPRYIPREIRTCKCGCNTTFEVKINSAKKYIIGHNNPRGW